MVQQARSLHSRVQHFQQHNTNTSKGGNTQKQGQQIRARGSLTTSLCRSVCSIPQCVCLLNSYTSSSCPDATSHNLFYCHDHHPTKHKRWSLTNKEVLLLSLPHINNVNKVLFEEMNPNNWYLKEECIACNLFCAFYNQYTYRAAS